MIMDKKRQFSTPMTLVLIIFFTLVVIFPLVRMLAYLLQTDVMKVITSRRFLSAVKNSLTTTSVATFISVSFAMILAWSIERVDVKAKSFWSFLFLIPMLIPSISHGTGLIILLGRNGILTNLFNIKGSIYGFWGIVVGSVMYSFPVAFLMFSDILRYEDSTPYEAASVLGINKKGKMSAIFFPYIRKPLIAIVFAVFTQIITDYGVPLMVGGQYTTLPVVMYQDVIGMLDFGKGSVIGLALLIPAIIAFILDSLNRDKGNTSFSPRPFTKYKGKWPIIIRAIAAIIIILPIMAFMIMAIVKKYPVDMSLTLYNISRTFNMKAGTFLFNSIIIAMFVALVGTTIAFISAYITTRSRNRYSKILHLFSIITLAIPGLVLGLSFVLFFKASFLMGTITILVLVNLVHFFASPYLMMYNTLGKINPNLEDVGQTLGIQKIAIIRDVIIPQSKSTILEMLTYFFVNSMMTISAVSFLATSRTQPIALMIPMFEAQMLIECTGVVSIIILLINLGMKVTVSIINNIISSRQDARYSTHELMGERA